MGGNITINNHKLTTANSLILRTPQSNRTSEENKLRKQEQKESGIDQDKREIKRGIIRRLEHLSYDSRDIGVVQPGELKTLGKHFYSSLTVPKGGYKKHEEGLFTRACTGQD